MHVCLSPLSWLLLMQGAKSLGGLNTGAAWARYAQESRSPARRKLSRAAARRKAELGFWAMQQAQGGEGGEGRVLDGVPGPKAARKGGPHFRPLPAPAHVVEEYSRRRQQQQQQQQMEESAGNEEAQDPWQPTLNQSSEPVLEVHQWRDEQVVVVYDHQHTRQQEQHQQHHQQEQQQHLATGQRDEAEAVVDGDGGASDDEGLQRALFNRLRRREAPDGDDTAANGEQQYDANAAQYHTGVTVGSGSYTADDGGSNGADDDDDDADPGQPLFARSMNQGGSSSSSQSRDRGSQ